MRGRETKSRRGIAVLTLWAAAAKAVEEMDEEKKESDAPEEASGEE